MLAKSVALKLPHVPFAHSLVQTLHPRAVHEMDLAHHPANTFRIHERRCTEQHLLIEDHVNRRTTIPMAWLQCDERINLVRRALGSVQPLCVSARVWYTDLLFAALAVDLEQLDRANVLQHILRQAQRFYNVNG